MGFDIITSPNMDSPVPPQGTTTYSDGKSNEYWANQFAFDQHIGSFDSPKDWGKMPQGLSVWDFISFDTDYLDIDGMGAEYVVETIIWGRSMWSRLL